MSSFSKLTDAAGRSRAVEFTLNGQALGRDTFARNELRLSTFEIPAEALAAESQNFEMKGLINQPWNRFAVGGARLSYGAGLRVGASQMTRMPYAADLAAGRHTWSDLDAAVAYTVFDLEGQRAQQLPRGSSATSVLPGMSAGTRLMVASETSVAHPVISDYVTGLSAEITEADYLIITTHAFDDWSLRPQDYADMRRRDEFGGHDVRILYYEDLRDEFGYGQWQDPRAIRNAIQYFATEGSVEYVLIIGKGRDFNFVRTAGEDVRAASSAAWIPTYGVPGSDNLLAVDVQTQKMSVAIGRMAVESVADLETIMGKVRSAEEARQLPQTIANQACTRRSSTCPGGATPANRPRCGVGCRGCSKPTRGTKRAPIFKTFAKESSLPVQESERIEIYEAINDGAGLVTFFGHAAASTFDFNIDNPRFYDNEGRYPMLLALGCNAGNMHQPDKSIGERFLLYEDKGFSAFGASIGLGYTGDLERFATNFYRFLGDEKQGEPLGEALRAAINIALGAGSSTTRQLGEQFTFQGDPAMLLYSDPGPDYILDEGTVSTAVTEGGALAYEATVRNVGLAGTDSVGVLVYRRRSRARAYPRRLLLGGGLRQRVSSLADGGRLGRSGRGAECTRLRVEYCRGAGSPFARGTSE